MLSFASVSGLSELNNIQDLRPERRAEWILFFEKRVLFEWFKDR
jgi:hypothetical protein